MRLALLAAAAFTVASCQSEPEVEARNASVAEVADKVRDATGSGFISPGRWSSTMVVEEVSAPGMPPEMAEQMKASMGQARSYESCLTPDQVKRPREEFFAGKNNQCRYDHFTMGDGQIDATMRCSQNGMNQVMKMAGSYAPDEYHMRMSTTTEGDAGPAAGLTMRMRVDSKRLGACAPGEGKAS